MEQFANKYFASCQFCQTSCLLKYLFLALKDRRVVKCPFAPASFFFPSLCNPVSSEVPMARPHYGQARAWVRAQGHNEQSRVGRERRPRRRRGCWPREHQPRREEPGRGGARGSQWGRVGEPNRATLDEPGRMGTFTQLAGTTGHPFEWLTSRRRLAAQPGSQSGCSPRHVVHVRILACPWGSSAP